MASDVERIKEKLSIVEVVSKYVDLEKAGANLKARCPFHNEKTPSFIVSPARGTYHCFGCDQGGDIFSFVESIENVEFVDALEILSRWSGIPLTGKKNASGGSKERLRKIIEASTAFYHYVLSKKTEAKKYLEERGVSDESIKTFELGYSPNEWSKLSDYLKKKGFSEKEIIDSGMGIKGDRGVYDRFRGRIMFPLRDVTGSKIGFSGRILPKNDDGKTGKYINSPETSLYKKNKVLYDISFAKQEIKEKKSCILVEGQMDVVASHQAGIKNVVAVSGTAFTEEHVEIINRFTDKLVFVFDGDNAGFKATARAVSVALEAGSDVLVAPLEAGKDPADLISNNEISAWKKVIESAVPFIDYAMGILKERSSDRSEYERMIKDHIYPYLRRTYNPLLRDEGLDKIAKTVGRSLSAVVEDYNKWFSSNKEESNKKSSQKDPVEERGESKEDKIIKKLTGIFLWKGKEDEKIGKKIKEELSRLYDDAEAQFPEIFSTNKGSSSKALESLVFEVESYYNALETLDDEVTALLLSLEIEILKKQIEETLLLLRDAEQQNKSKEAEELLSRYQDIVNKMNQLLSLG